MAPRAHLQERSSCFRVLPASACFVIVGNVEHKKAPLLGQAQPRTSVQCWAEKGSNKPSQPAKEPGACLNGDDVVDVEVAEVISAQDFQPASAGTGSQNKERHKPAFADIAEDIAPGDPMEEGWVADTTRDSRARHWWSDDGPVSTGGSAASMRDAGAGAAGTWQIPRYDPSAAARPVGTGPAAGGSLSVDDRDDGGNEGGQGGAGSGGGDTRSRASDGGGGDRMFAASVVYLIFMAALASFWWYVYMVVSKPELIGKKISKLIKLSREHWMKRRRRKLTTASMRAPVYRTLCIVRAGRSTRRLVSPSPIDVGHGHDGEMHVEQTASLPGLFLKVPAPDIAAHPLFVSKDVERHSLGEPGSRAGAMQGMPMCLRRRLRPPRGLGFKASLEEELAGQSNIAAHVLLPSASFLWPGRYDSDIETTQVRDACSGTASGTVSKQAALAATLDESPFAGFEAAAGKRSLEQSMASPLMGSSVAKTFRSLCSLDEYLPPGVELMLERTNTRLPPLKLKRRSRLSGSQLPPRMLRQAAWSGDGGSRRWTTDAPSSHGGSEWRGDMPEGDPLDFHMCSQSFVSAMVPGSLAMHNLRQSTLRRAGRLSSLDRHGGLEVLRTVSQPALAFDPLPVDRMKVLRRSSSINSIQSRPETGRSVARTESKDGQGQSDANSRHVSFSRTESPT